MNSDGHIVLRCAGRGVGLDGGQRIVGLRPSSLDHFDGANHTAVVCINCAVRRRSVWRGVSGRGGSRCDTGLIDTNAKPVEFDGVLQTIRAVHHLDINDDDGGGIKASQSGILRCDSFQGGPDLGAHVERAGIVRSHVENEVGRRRAAHGQGVIQSTVGRGGWRRESYRLLFRNGAFEQVVARGRQFDCNLEVMNFTLIGYFEDDLRGRINACQFPIGACPQVDLV